jgi:transcriptional regulator with XRE-family HTH domain
MGMTPTSADPPEGRVLDHTEPGPTVSRMLVGAELRRLRTARGITREAAGLAIRASHSKISRLELGRTGFKRRDVSDLLTLYGVDDAAERQIVLDMVDQANAPGWWRAYADVVPDWLEACLGLEHGASVIRNFEVQFVPGLLQTETYARAILRLTHPNEPRAVLERRVELRMRRQDILHRTDPPHLWVVIDEAGLRRSIGDPATMRDQLDHLIQAARLPHVNLQVLPLSAGGHAALGGAITLLRFPEGEVPDVVYLEQLISAVYLDKPAEVEHYRHVLNRLVAVAQSPDAAEATVRSIRDTT